MWSNDGKTATIAMKEVPVFDQPKWPARDAAAVPAIMTFKMIFEATNRSITYEDKAKHFRVTGFLATCRIQAQVEVPSANFTWKSEPIERCRPADFAVIGEEVNGKYYDEAVIR
jgi:hypothetical protein